MTMIIPIETIFDDTQIIHVLTYYQIIGVPENISSSEMNGVCQTFDPTAFSELFFSLGNRYRNKQNHPSSLASIHWERVEIQTTAVKAQFILNNPYTRAQYDQELAVEKERLRVLAAEERERMVSRGIYQENPHQHPLFTKWEQFRWMNYYQILGLPENSGYYQTLSTIRNVDFFAVYFFNNSVVRETQPIAFERLMRSMLVLSNSEKRQRYDRGLIRERQKKNRLRLELQQQEQNWNMQQQLILNNRNRILFFFSFFNLKPTFY